jgi:glutamyl-tRNA reductase
MTSRDEGAGAERLLAVGLSHKTAAIDDREKAALDERRVRSVLRATSLKPC